jgi:hypothetical protein
MNILEEDVFDNYSRSPGYKEFINNAVFYIEKYGIDTASLVVKFEPTQNLSVYAEYQLSINGYHPYTKEQFTLVQSIEIR